MHPEETKSSTIKLSNHEEEDGESGLFPHRLRALLNEDETGATEWFDDGSGFRICSKIDFVDSLLPKYFRCTKYRSFTRQLNVYGFKRVPDPKKKCKYGFRHTYFRRDFPDLMHFMSRRKPTFARVRREEIIAAVPPLHTMLECANSSSNTMTMGREGDDSGYHLAQKASSSNLDSEDMSSYSASLATTLDDEDIAFTDIVMLQEMLKDSPKGLRSFDLLSPSSSYMDMDMGNENDNSGSFHPDKPK